MKRKLNNTELNFISGGIISKLPFEACNCVNEGIFRIEEGTWGFSVIAEDGEIKFFGNNLCAAIDWDWEKNSYEYIGKHLFFEKEDLYNYYHTIYVYSSRID